MNDLSSAFLRVAKRAERQDDEVLYKTFVDFGSVFDVLSSVDHQIIYGRRGTGKTHILTALKHTKKMSGEVAIQIDMRNLGSAGGIYSDPSMPVTQRATRLLVDVLSIIHASLFELAIEQDAIINLGVVGPALDEFFDAHSKVSVSGSIVVEEYSCLGTSDSSGLKTGVDLGLSSLNINLSGTAEVSGSETLSTKKTTTGIEQPRVNFGRVSTCLRKIVDNLPNKRLWIFFDEWSEIPLDLQPILADLLRRAIFPLRGLTVKIAAIELRSKFLIPDRSVGNIGLELGADISAAVTLDDYMVFDNDEEKAVSFFRSLIYKHVKSVMEGEGRVAPNTEHQMISEGFTQVPAFVEIVRASEGVPRDAIHILAQSAQRAGDCKISIPEARLAAASWYQNSKEAAVNAKKDAKQLLLWIVDKVIKERKTKAFLLESSVSNELIDYLYDERVLHVLRRGISAQDLPGKRFNVYGIDYGCYVDLINTKQAPQGLLNLSDSDAEEEAQYCSDVPKSDLRSIRRCVLDLSHFYGDGLHKQ